MNTGESVCLSIAGHTEVVKEVNFIEEDKALFRDLETKQYESEE